MTKKRKYGFKMAAMARQDGSVAACSKEFKSQEGEMQVGCVLTVKRGKRYN